MIKSMTGFGKCQLSFGLRTLHIDIRCLNGKLLDLNLRLPSTLRNMEAEMRAEINTILERGKVDVFIQLKQADSSPGIQIDKQRFVQHFEALKLLASEVGAHENNIFAEVLRLPDILKVEEEEELDEAELQTIKNTLRQALSDVNTYRLDEGKGLEIELTKRLDLIQTLLEDVGPFEEERMVLIRKRLQQKIDELGQAEELSKNRFEEEMIYFLEKLDISEEKQRLLSHLNYFRETMNSNGASGRKLGFISQEMGREINTIGSKANHAEMQKVVVLMKDELEKIKEQLNNIL